ncbi:MULTISPECIES: hypothetical protein [unclassified Mycobacterium]|uniref:hypothetical protein n=1 Tax=unclassified Mycobacterium TaxID=2642494 RepID=UPI0027403677|nr:MULTISPECIES: hypothetical protein [unclassified Mycobacterium]MDP7703701.1 hypothetical protein [Mycobacterium sp. TY815]MDP7722183.1 hypothetical protein [Mycobacterium sp. TY814]
MFGWLTQNQRDAAAAQTWAGFYSYATANGLHMLCIEKVYQHAHRGSKAIVFIYGENAGARRDAWFWWTQVQQGSVVAAYLSEGWGPHTNRDHVLYIGDEHNETTGVYAAAG